MQTNTAKIHVINDKAAAALAQTAANEDIAPKRTGFLDRVKAVGSNLKNKSGKDWAWMGANVAVGAAVKFATVAALGTAISAAAAPLIAGAATAAIAGAAVGLAKSALNNARDVRDAHTSGRVMEVIDGHKPIAKIVPVDRFWSKKSLVKTAKEMAVGAGISGLTFGLLSSADIAHHIENATGVSFTKGLSSLFNKASQAVAGTYHDLANHFTSAHTVSGPSASGIIKPAAVVAPVAPIAPVIETPLETPVAVTTAPAVVHAPAVHHTHHVTHHAAHVAHTAPVTTEVEPHNVAGIDDETRANAMKWAAEQNSSAASIPAEAPVAEATAAADLPPAEIDAPEAVAAPIQINIPETPDTTVELGHAQQVMVAENGPQLEPQKMAAACVANIPATQTAYDAAAHNIPVSCAIVKDTMDAGDYVTLRDANAPTATTSKLRVLFSSAATKMTDFLSQAVGREGVPALMTFAEPAPAAQ